MKTMLAFMRAMLKMPPAWLPWLAVIVTLNIIVPLLLISHPEAQLMLASTMASLLTMMLIFSRKGYVRLLGIGHIFWVPALFWLAGRLAEAPPGWLRRWILAVLVVDSLSLVIDAVDVVRYARGEREPTVS